MAHDPQHMEEDIMSTEEIEHFGADQVTHVDVAKSYCIFLFWKVVSIGSLVYDIVKGIFLWVLSLMSPNVGTDSLPKNDNSSGDTPLTEICWEEIEQKYQEDQSSIDIKPVSLIQVIEKIFEFSDLKTSRQSTEIEEISKLDMDPQARYTMYHLSWLLSCKCASGLEIKAKTVTDFFDDLGPYTWESRAVLLLAAFAMSYGDLYVTLARNEAKLIPVVKYLRMLKLPSILERQEDSENHFNSFHELMSVMIETAKEIAEFKNKITKNRILESTVAKSNVTTAIHRVTRIFIKVMFTFASHNKKIIQKNDLYDSEKSSEAKKYRSFKTELRGCKTYITEFLQSAEYKEVEDIFNEDHNDIGTLVLKLFPGENSIMGSEGKNYLEEIRGKTVALLITEIDTDLSSLKAIENLYTKLKHEDNHFIIIWIPLIMDPPATPEQDWEFSNTAKQRGWLWCPPSRVGAAFSSYALKKWKSKTRTTMAVFSSNGKLITDNAVPLVQLYGGNSEFDFKKDIDARKAVSVDSLMRNMLFSDHKGNRNMILCGGHDVALIKKFVEAVRKINAKYSQTNLVVYVGTKERADNSIQQNLDADSDEDVVWLSNGAMRDFWRDIDNLWHLSMKWDDRTPSQQLSTLLYTKDGLWASAFYKGRMLVSYLVGQKLIDSFERFNTTIGAMDIARDGQVWEMLWDIIKAPKVIGCRNCKRTTRFPYTDNPIAEIECFECHCIMKPSFIIYKCSDV